MSSVRGGRGPGTGRRERASSAGCGRGTGGVAGGENPRRAGAGAEGRVRDAGGRVWAGAGAGPAAWPAAETLGARGSLTASEEEDSA